MRLNGCGRLHVPLGIAHAVSRTLLSLDPRIFHVHEKQQLKHQQHQLIDACAEENSKDIIVYRV